MLFYFLDQEVEFGKYVLLISGLGLILTAVLNPEGIAGGLRLTYSSLRKKYRRRSGPPAQSGAAVENTRPEVQSGPAAATR